MKKFIIIGIIATAIVFGVTYYVFHNKLGEAREEVKAISRTNKHEFLLKKHFYLKKIENDQLTKKGLFNDYFDLDKAEYLRDTLVTFFVYEKRLPISCYDTTFYSCLLNKCNTIIKNKKAEKRIEERLNNLKKVYGKEVEHWFTEIGKEKFININYGHKKCNDYFPNDSSYAINKSAFSEFSNFLDQKRAEKKKYKRLSNQAHLDYRRELNSIKRNLNRNEEAILKNELNESSVVIESIEELQYKGDILGTLNYSLERHYFKEATFNSTVDDVYKNIYENNKLRNGAVPYAYCYGYNKDCSGYSCSKIKVVTSSSSDVVVTIKTNDRVVRHAYIRANNSYTFDLPNGTYQTFFYYGKGWNPHKKMKEGRCGNLKGGFVMNERVGKDDPQYIHNQILTYELIRQRFGNFSTKSSSKMEAF